MTWTFRRLPIIPRVNGDETVTLLFPGWGGTVDPKEPRATLLRRVRAGEWLAIAGDGLTETLVLRVELEPRR